MLPGCDAGLRLRGFEAERSPQSIGALARPNFIVASRLQSPSSRPSLAAWRQRASIISHRGWIEANAQHGQRARPKGDIAGVAIVVQADVRHTIGFTLSAERAKLA